jgi:hypothetical protein
MMPMFRVFSSECDLGIVSSFQLSVASAISC